MKDFPTVEKYIRLTFPDINVNDIPIYVATDKGLSAAGLSYIGGCYVHHMYLIVVKNKITMGGGHTAKNKFDKTLQSALEKASSIIKTTDEYGWTEYVKVETPVEMEDVLVHEMIHAVSGAANRSNRRYTLDEEEFVYTNTIDFYKDKGMTEEEIVNRNFLPFCVQDVLSDDKEWVKIFEELSHDEYGIKVIDLDAPQEKMNRFLGKHAGLIVPIIIKRGRKLGQHMIDLYNEYGRGVQVVPQIVDSGTSTRFQSIDMDDDW